MVISLFVSLVSSLAVNGLSSKITPQTRTCILKSLTADVLFRGSDDGISDVTSVVFEDQKNRCAVSGRKEACCPPHLTCCGPSQASPHVFCCPIASCSSESIDECAMHMFESPTFVGGGNCAMSQHYAPDRCFEHLYKKSRVLQPLPIHNRASSLSQGLNDCIALATVNPVPTSTPLSSLSTDGAVPTCASQNWQPEDIGRKGQNWPISDGCLETPTAGEAMMRDFAVKSHSEDNWDGKNGNRRLRRLGCVVMSLLVMTVVMLVF